MRANCSLERKGHSSCALSVVSVAQIRSGALNCNRLVFQAFGNGLWNCQGAWFFPRENFVPKMTIFGRFFVDWALEVQRP